MTLQFDEEVIVEEEPRPAKKGPCYFEKTHYKLPPWEPHQMGLSEEPRRRAEAEAQAREGRFPHARFFNAP